MSINFQPLNNADPNYSKVIELYKEAFPGVRRVPSWVLQFMMRKGKVGFSVLYENDTWIGLIYLTEIKDIVFVHFFAISETRRSGGFGSKVLTALSEKYATNRIVLNIEVVEEQADNYPQRVKRKAFYIKNGFAASGYIIQEPGERLELLILGGQINKQEIDAVYEALLGKAIGRFYRPEVIQI